jgi:NADH-ubiquinone oxidoreductase chain 5
MSLPLYGSVVSGFFGRKVGVSGAQFVTILGVIVTTIVAIVTFFEVGFNNITLSINLFRWIDSEWFGILWGFQYDSLTVSMLIPVLIISSLVHIYSVGYMDGDPHNQRFFSYLSLFTFMMIILVTANNYLLMFVGWEGVGVCSYLLVSFWFTRIAANQSSMSAFLTNRVGDCFLTIGMFGILWSLGNLDYGVVFSLAPYINETIITFIGICMLIGAMAKSSQVGLHVWLPMAMEGPTPVSALIHAATMVTAGVYLLMRSSPWIEYSSTVLLLCLWLGAITTVFSSLIGLFQQDIKKVIAYSTMSQLGMMVIAVGLSSYNIALFHLINHAFYKGLLFLGAGAVIHAVADNQDFRRYGGLISFLPLTYSVILIASLSLVAFPFMTGFYSKDFILESAFGQFHFSGIAVYIIATIGAIFTTLYSVKVLYLTFLASPNGPRTSYKHAHESNWFISLPLIILAIFSIFFGFITKDIFIGLGSNFFIDNSIFIHPMHEIMIDTEFGVPTLFKILPFIFTVAFSVVALFYSEFYPEVIINFKLSRLGYNIFGFFNQRFLVELFYNNYIVNTILYWGGLTTKILDKGSIEMAGPYGLERLFGKLSKYLAGLSTGNISIYALFILVGFVIYLFAPYLITWGINILFIGILLLGLLRGINMIISYGDNHESNSLEANVRLFSTSSSKRMPYPSTTRPSSPVFHPEKGPIVDGKPVGMMKVHAPVYTPNFNYVNQDKSYRIIRPNPNPHSIVNWDKPNFYVYESNKFALDRINKPFWYVQSPHTPNMSSVRYPGDITPTRYYYPDKIINAYNIPDMSSMPGIKGIPGNWSREVKPWATCLHPRPSLAGGRRPIIRLVPSSDPRFLGKVTQEIWVWEHNVWFRRKSYYQDYGYSWATWNYEKSTWEWKSSVSWRPPMVINPNATLFAREHRSHLDMKKWDIKVKRIIDEFYEYEKYLKKAPDALPLEEILRRNAEAAQKYKDLEEIQKRGGGGCTGSGTPVSNPEVPTDGPVDSGSNPRKINIILTGIVLVTVLLGFFWWLSPHLPMPTSLNLPGLVIDMPTVNLPSINIPAINIPLVSIPKINISAILKFIL